MKGKPYKGLVFLLLVTLGFGSLARAQDEADIDSLLLRSSQLLQQNDLAQAIDLLETGSSVYPDSIEVQNNLAIAYLGAGRYEDAIALMRSLAIQDRELQIIDHNLAELEASDRGTVPVDPIVFIERAPRGDLAVEESVQDSVEPVAMEQEPVPQEPPSAEVETPSSSADNLGSALIPGSSSPSEADIRAMIEAWAAAWSSKNFDDYLSFYSSDFEPRTRSYGDWQSFRQEMVTKPGPIELRLENFEISIYSYEVRARFDQHYRSDDYNDDIRKLLVIDISEGYWKIMREATLEVYSVDFD